MGIVDKIHKLFKTDTYKLKVILSKDIQDEVDFVKFHEDYGDTIDDHFDRRFIYLFMMFEMLSKNVMLRKQ